jgi:DNA-binding GntR family transcriptional regulator
MPARAVEFRSVADHVERALRERILEGVLEPGSRLHQEALADELGVSRTPLREALGRLAADGLVDVLPNRGARVADVREEDLRASYEARLVIEPGAAALAARRADARALDALRVAVRELAATGGDVRAAFHANRAFHVGLVAASGNPHLMRLAEALWVNRLGMRVYEAQRDMSQFIAQDAASHAEILDAIVERDPAAAERRTRAHIGHAMDCWLAARER